MKDATVLDVVVVIAISYGYYRLWDRYSQRKRAEWYAKHFPNKENHDTQG